MIRRMAVAAAVSFALAGCSLDFIPWPEEGADLFQAAPAPATVSVDPNDPAQDTRLAMARFGFILMAVGGLAGVVALQSKMQRDKDKHNTDTKQEDIGWPIAAFGLGIGLPIYIVSSILAGQGLEEAERKKLAPGP